MATRAGDVTRVPNMRRAQATHPVPGCSLAQSLARGGASLPCPLPLFLAATAPMSTTPTAAMRHGLGIKEERMDAEI